MGFLTVNVNDYNGKVKTVYCQYFKMFFGSTEVVLIRVIYLRGEKENNLFTQIWNEPFDSYREKV